MFRCTPRALLVLLLAASTPAYAIDPEKQLTQLVHTAWTPRDGAPAGIRSIVQTSDGYLWLGTRSGTWRFDGSRFEAWNPPSGWNASATDRRGSLLITRDGALWTSIGAGLARIRGREFVWHPLPIGENRIESLVEETDDSLLLVAQDGAVYRFTRHDGSSRRLTADDGIPAGKANHIWRDRDGTTWLVADSVWPGASAVRQASETRPARYSTEFGVAFAPRGAAVFQKTNLQLGQVGAFSQAADGTIWMAETTRAVRIFRSADGHFLPPSPEVYVGASDVQVDRHGSIWVASLGDGLRRLAGPRAMSTEIVERFSSRGEPFTEDNDLSGDVLYAVFEDREGNIWIGSANGLDRFRDVRLAEFTSREGVRLNINMGGTSLAPHRAGVAVVSKPLEGVMTGVDRAGRMTRHPFYVDAPVASPPGCLHPTGGGANDTNAVTRSPDGTLSIVGFRMFVVTPKAWRCVPFSPSGDNSIEMTAAIVARQGGVWLGSSVGELWRYGADGSLTRTAASRAQRVGVVFEQQDGSVWFGGRAGLARVHDGQLLEVDEAGGLPRGGAYTVFDGTGGGVWILGPKGLSHFRDGRANGVPALDRAPIAGCWSSVRVDADLWFNCSHGLLRIAAAELEASLNGDHTPAFELLDASDDLRSAPIQGSTDQSIVRSDDGRIWFLTQKGLGYVEPGRRDSAPPPSVYIESAAAGSDRFDVAAETTLGPLLTALKVSFTAISLGHPERLRFQYLLEGADREWKDTQERFVAYDALRPGRYRFRIKAVDYRGIWSAGEAQWRFQIAPRWYQTWAFRLAVAALVAALLWLAVRVVVARQSARLRREFAVQLNERTRIAGELHDTLLQGFQGTTMHLHALAARIPPEWPERGRFDAVLADTREVLDEGRKAIWAMRESSMASTDLLAAFKRVGAQQNDRPPILNAIEEGEPQETNPIQCDMLYQLGREALLNAFQHSRGQEVHVTLHWEAKAVRLTIRDDGVGIPEHVIASGREGHYGLTGMRERAAKLQAQFEVRSAPGGGTEIAVVVPAASIYFGRQPRWYRFR